MYREYIDPRILDKPVTEGETLRRAIHKAEVEQARLEGSVEQRATWAEANYLRGWNECMASVLGVVIDIANGNRQP